MVLPTDAALTHPIRDIKDLLSSHGLTYSGRVEGCEFYFKQNVSCSKSSSVQKSSWTEKQAPSTATYHLRKATYFIQLLTSRSVCTVHDQSFLKVCGTLTWSSGLSLASSVFARPPLDPLLSPSACARFSCRRSCSISRRSTRQSALLGG